MVYFWRKWIYGVEFLPILTSSDTAVLHKILYHTVDISILNLLHIDTLVDTIPDSNIHGIDAICIPYNNGPVTSWLPSIIAVFNVIASISTVLIRGECWMIKEFYPTSIAPLCQ